jgi:hypothetical protein
MPNKRKFKAPTGSFNARFPKPLLDWLKKKSRSTETSQTDLLLDALQTKYPELKGMLS